MHSAPKQSEFVKTCPFGKGFYLPNSPAIQTLLSNAANQIGEVEIATQAIKKL